MSSEIRHICTGLWAAALLLLVCGPLTAAEVSLKTPGASGALRSGLQAASLTLATADNKDAEAQDLLSSARADYALMIGTLYSAGYYGGVVSITADGREVADIPPLGQPRSVAKIVITVTPGPQFIFSRARIAPLADGTKLPDGFRKGRPALSGVIRQAVEAGVNGWRDQGYAKAAIRDQKIIADHADNTLDADITLKPGPQLSFGKVILQGDSRVRPGVIRKIMGLPEGTRFSPDELDKAATRLRRTGVFRSVTLREADQVGPGNTLDITAITVDEKPRRIGVGAEVSTLDGLSLSAFWLRRNVFRGAEKLRLDGGIAGIGGSTGGTDYNLSARIDRPATLSPDTNGFLLGAYKQDDAPDYLEKSGKIAIGFEHFFSDQLRGSIGLSLNYSGVTDDTGNSNYHYVGLPTTVTWDKRDDPLEPTKGLYLDSEVMPFLGFSGSASGVHGKLDMRGYRGLDAKDRFVLAGRLQLGSIMGAGIGEVPPGLLFFSGGGGTVRGQPYESLVIDHGGGVTSGGRSFLGYSAELRVRLTDTIGAVGFYDSGYISADSLPGTNSEHHAGAGLGFRYFTGIGAIRLDVARPIGGSGNATQFYIGIGQAF